MECPLGTFRYQDFRPLTFVVVNPRIDSHYLFYSIDKINVRTNHNHINK